MAITRDLEKTTWKAPFEKELTKEEAIDFLTRQLDETMHSMNTLFLSPLSKYSVNELVFVGTLARALYQSINILLKKNEEA